MGKDSKLKVQGWMLILVFVLLLGWMFWKEANAAEFELGPGILSGEYSEGWAVILNQDVGEHWRIGGGVITEQYCHCNYPADLETNIFFHGQRVVKYKLLEMGIGAGYFQNTNRALGKNLTWSLSLGLAGEHWSVRLRHFSNAGSGKPNLGQDMVTLGYRF